MAKRKRKTNRINWQQMFLTDESPWVIKEAYRELRTNILFSLPGNTCKVIGVTSPQRAAGKSITSINLASSLSSAGKRVLLIDADLRLPSVASKLGIKQEPGLSNILIGSIRPTDAILQVPLLYGACVLPSGVVPPDPTRLLMGKSIKQLVEELKKYYDYIIFDLPPINMVTDAVLLSEVIDGYLMVIRHNNTERKGIEEALSKMSFGNAQILGFVYNDVPIEKKRAGEYTYSQYK